MYRDSRVLYRVFFFVPLTCIQRVKSSLSRVLLCSPHPSHFPHFCLQSSSTDDHPIFSRRTAWSATPPSTDSSLLTLCLLACDTLHSSHVARFARVSIDSFVFLYFSLLSFSLFFSLFFLFLEISTLFLSLSSLFLEISTRLFLLFSLFFSAQLRVELGGRLESSESQRSEMRSRLAELEAQHRTQAQVDEEVRMYKEQCQLLMEQVTSSIDPPPLRTDPPCSCSWSRSPRA